MFSDDLFRRPPETKIYICATEAHCDTSTHKNILSAVLIFTQAEHKLSERHCGI
jgi:hypothetical protein